MKTKLFTLLLAIAASVGTMLAEKVQIGDLYYNLDATNQTAEVTYRSYTDYGYNEDWGITTANIPASVTYSGTTYSVTSIGQYAFYGCSSLTSVTIPNSVTSIEGFAFAYCSSLTSVTIPNSVTSIGDYAFYQCSSLTSVTIPNSVTSIGDWAFGSCSSLTSVTIPNSVTSIGVGAFYDCSSLPVVDNLRYADTYLVEAVDKTLSSYTIKKGTKWIGDGAFYDCSSLTSVTIPNSVTSIGDYAFNGCSSLTSPVYNAHVFAFMPKSYSGAYTIPDGIASIAVNAFEDCSGLTSVTIPNSVTSIGSSAFSGCSSLTSLSVEAGNTVYDSRNNCNAIIETSTNTLIFGCQNTTIPNSVTSIGEYAFYNCSGLTSVTIPNSVTSIGDYAFSRCSGLTSVTIGNSVTSIGWSAFSGCSSLPVVDNLRYADTYLVEAVDKTLSSYTIKEGTKWIGNGAFEDCSSLTSVTIPNSVTSIGIRAFYRCSRLTSVTIGNGVTSIGWDAFYGCSSLTSVTIPNSVTSIGDWAFGDCSSLTSMTIGNSVTSIGDYAFEGCSGLTSLMIEAGTPPTIKAYSFYDIDDDGYPTNPLNISIYVPCGTLDTYKTAEVWSDYASLIKYVPLPYKVSTIAENGNVTTTDVTICDPFVTCTATPDYGYHFTQWSDGVKDNPRIAQITQDTTFTAEFAYARVGTCGKDLALVWSYDPANKVLTIGNAGSFTENMQFGVEAPGEMEELVIGNSVTAIGANAFAGIETLKKVSIGESVKTIGEQAFYNCVNLETIFNYRPTPTNAYSTAFDGVDKFECKLYVLPNSIDMYKNASVWRDFYYTYAIGAEETTMTTNDVKVEPQDNAATVTWPTSENAASYTIQITKDGVVFCTLIFNANGQLTGIAFAPGRDGRSMAPAAVMTANGLQFTVTGLDSNTQYGYSLTAKDANEQPIATYSGSFTTTSEGVPTGIDNTPFLSGEGRGEASKLLRNGEVLILRDGKTYTIQGVEVK